jgi:hypothetical protein
MDWLIATLTIVGTFAAGVIGNIVAHDFCQFTPKICRRLIERAVRVLPVKQREQRLEEWLAHLNDCVSVTEQFNHAITCVFGARKLRYIPAGNNPLAARVQFAGIGVLDLDMATTIVALHFFKNLGTRFKKPKESAATYKKGLYFLWLFISAYCIAVFKCRKCGRIDGKKLGQLIAMIMRAVKEKNNQIVVDVGGVRFDVAKIAMGQLPEMKSTL